MFITQNVCYPFMYTNWFYFNNEHSGAKNFISLLFMLCASDHLKYLLLAALWLIIQSRIYINNFTCWQLHLRKPVFNFQFVLLQESKKLQNIFSVFAFAKKLKWLLYPFVLIKLFVSHEHYQINT